MDLGGHPLVHWDENDEGNEFQQKSLTSIIP